MKSPLEQIKAHQAWQSHRDGSGKRIAVLDSGIASHPALNPNVRRDLGISFAGEGPLHAHGTKVAGIIGASHEPLGVLKGVAWHADMMSVRVLGQNKKGSIEQVIQGIDYAVAHGADILNLSIEVEQNDNDADDAIHALRRCMLAASQKGALFVTAAGNDGVDLSEHQVFPASFNTRPRNGDYPSPINQIVVGAATGDDQHARKNFDPKTVDIAAPDNAVTTAPNDGYGSLAATSAAAAYVTGVAALVWTANPDWKATDVITHILESADRVAALAPYVNEGRRLNARAAVQGPFSIRSTKPWIAGERATLELIRSYPSSLCDTAEVHLSYTYPYNFYHEVFCGHMVDDDSIKTIEFTPKSATGRAQARIRCGGREGLLSYSDEVFVSAAV